MIFEEQKIKGVFLITPEPFYDKRGIYRRHFCQNEFKIHNLPIQIAQSNIVENKHAFTLRGFHYQQEPYSEAKTISCLIGGVYEIVVDLRQKSSTYLQWQGFRLNDKNKKSLFIPAGCAHAVLTLKDDTIIQYYSSEFYNPQAERGIRYNDPLFKFKWPRQPKIISEKDKGFPDFTP